MLSAGQAALLSWSIPPAATFALALTALVYLRGWILLRRAGVPFVPPWRAASFGAGILSLWVALASPVDVFSGFLLTAHMLQHMMLMMLAPPLILLGAPLIPLVRGLPIFAGREFAGPFLNWRAANRVGRVLTHPIVALLLMGVVMFAWHTPRLYELALASGTWHEVEHACFFFTSVIFWWPVIQPWPSQAQWPRWAMVPYLLIADLQNTVLSAILVFSDRVLYPSYIAEPRLFGFAAQPDQVAAGAIMWVIGSFAFVVPAVVIAVQCLQSQSARTVSMPASPRKRARASAPPKLLQSFSAHRLLRSRFSGRAMEFGSFLLLFMVAGLVWAALSSSPSDDDDLAIRSQQQSGHFAIAVFAPNGELETGPVTFNVLVQDRNTQEALLDAKVDLTAQAAGDSQAGAAVEATSGSENKLLQSAQLNFATAGDWTVNISVRRDSEAANFSLPIQLVKAAGEGNYPWSYLLLLAFAGILALAYIYRHHVPKASRLPDSAGKPVKDKAVASLSSHVDTR